MADEILVPQPQRLPDPHPRPEQEREQEPVPQPPLRIEHRLHLSHRQRPRQPLLLCGPAASGALHARRDPMQKRLVAARPRTAASHQPLSDLDAIARATLVEAVHRPSARFTLRGQRCQAASESTITFPGG